MAWVTPFLCTLALSMLAASAMWRLSLRLEDAGIVDVFWGYGFAMIATLAYVWAPSPGLRESLLWGAALLWSLRLGTHLWIRCVGRPEDFRYRDLRAYHGPQFGRRSLTRVFAFQALVQWVLSLPLQVAPLWPGPPGLGWLDYVGFGVFVSGFVIESVADFQLERFRRGHESAGRVFDQGLWRFSRHPNYFGECVIAWGLFLVVSQTQHGIWFIFSPLLLTFLITRVSGVPILEQGLEQRLSGYAEYVERTPRFMPGIPREGRS